MDSMYDRLGILLKQALENNYIPQNFQADETDKSVIQNTEKITPKRVVFYTVQAKKSKKTIKNKNNQFAENIKAEIIRINKKIVVPDYLVNAFKMLKIDYDIDFSNKEELKEFTEKLKKVYKERLIYFHPDTKCKNPLVQKVATEKTRQIIDSYNRICSWISSL